MLSCDKCNREFKSKRGLTTHSKSCSAEPTELIEESSDEVVCNEELSNSNEGRLVQQELSDNIKRKLGKLRDARKSTFDAEARNNIDIKIMELENV